jgi:spore coat protein I
MEDNMQGFDKIISDSYEFDIKDMLISKDGCIIQTSNGRKLLKRSLIAPERVLFVHGAKEHLFNNGFKSIDRYCCTKDGSPHIAIDGNCYTVSELVEGRECNFDNRADAVQASRTLALLHTASRGYVPPQDSRIQDDLGKIPGYFTKRLEELKKLKKVAARGKSRFDHLFLQYYDYFYNTGEYVLSQISNSCYNTLAANARKEGSFCHHDYTHHNIIFNSAGVSITNFDFCCFELKVYDIANLLRRKMRKCNWSINDAAEIIQEYRTIAKISDDEFLVMKYILQFPQKFWRVANRFYNSRRSWSEKSFVSRLQEVVDEIEYHKQFIERYEDIT